ncbi:hypothetical protein T459_16656 [Capsicum annuum]|uniref:Ubiquitin-like protease family profile domain-containing protein n=1 Tax=Capsicum annuum TaxID=4072 RepID=A0A2G2Z9G5_CAPAN|nr:hypothetical protein T459_16656 [Capsicum annuum]
MSFFLTLRSEQTLSDPKVVDGIKMKLFEAIIITRKIILEGGLIVIDDGSRSGSGSVSGAAVRASDAPLIVFETTSYYDYDYIGYTNFFLDFATSSECSACKCQDYKAKYDGVINAINTLTSSIKEMTSKRAVIPSKRISYPYTLLEIKVAKRRRKDISKPEVFRNKECLINIVKGFNIPAGLPWHLVDEMHIPINYGDEFHQVLAVIILKKRHIRVYDSMLRKRRFGPSSVIQKLAKILPTYLDINDLLDQNICTD